MFCFHVDEYTDVTSCAQLFVFVRYIHSGDIKEELLFCEEQQATSADALEKIKLFFDWRNCSGNAFVGFELMELSSAMVDPEPSPEIFQ